ncbi:MAG: nuclear transport factor 2 family protein [Thermoanaerobaculia bacterium]
MKLTLPESVSLYFDAENRHAPELVPQCFTADALVRDEKTTRHGIAEIQGWIAETAQKYQHSTEPLSTSQDGSTTIVRSRLAGQFPGSPIELDFRFILRDGKICELEIR